MQLDGQNAQEALRSTDRTVPDAVEDMAAQKAAEIHRWHQTHPPGPAPWLPAVPAQIAEHPHWGPYFQQRTDLLQQQALAVAQTAATWTPDTAPAWANTTLMRDPHLTRDLAVWRAAHAVPDTDTRPTGPTARELEARTPQQRLRDRHEAAGHNGKANVAAAAIADKISPQLRNDPSWPALANTLDRAQESGIPEADILHAANARPLPADQPAAALRWRLTDLTPAANPSDAADLAPSGRWAALAESIHPGITNDPSWGSLTEMLDRASQQGIDLHAELPRIAAQRPLALRHPARSLDLAVCVAYPSTVGAYVPFANEGDNNLSTIDPGIEPAISVARNGPRI